MITTIDILRVFQLAIVALGAVIVYYGGTSYLKTRNKSMLFLAFGFLFVTIGAVTAGILFEVLKFDLVSVETVGAGLEVLGIGLIVYSILVIK